MGLRREISDRRGFDREYMGLYSLMLLLALPLASSLQPTTPRPGQVYLVTPVRRAPSIMMGRKFEVRTDKALYADNDPYSLCAHSS